MARSEEAVSGRDWVEMATLRRRAGRLGPTRSTVGRGTAEPRHGGRQPPVDTPAGVWPPSPGRQPQRAATETQSQGGRLGNLTQNHVVRIKKCGTPSSDESLFLNQILMLEPAVFQAAGMSSWY